MLVFSAGFGGGAGRFNERASQDPSYDQEITSVAIKNETIVLGIVHSYAKLTLKNGKAVRLEKFQVQEVKERGRGKSKSSKTTADANYSKLMVGIPVVYEQYEGVTLTSINKDGSYDLHVPNCPDLGKHVPRDSFSSIYMPPADEEVNVSIITDYESDGEATIFKEALAKPNKKVKDAVDVLTKSGDYNLQTCNCQHAAQQIFNHICQEGSRCERRPNQSLSPRVV